MDKQMIKVVGIQRDPRGEESAIELFTEAKRYQKNNAVYIVYEESEISGMEGSTTTLKIEGNNRVSMKRYGSADSHMVFELGRHFSGDYRTPYGDFKMELKTRGLSIDLKDDEKRGKIEIDYDMMIVGLAETQNRLEITLS
ncbi:YwiB family protein [Alkaliphilus crotonatoxidans]